MRTFEDKPAARIPTGMIIGITGVTGCGKTWSALRLASGIQKVVGGEIFAIDTESEGTRMLDYSEYFKFRHVPFKPPYGPLDYLDAINHCEKKGAKIIIIDSASHEHDGEGGLLDIIENYLNEKAGDDWKKRENYNWIAQAKAKEQRKKLNRRIMTLSGRIYFILCYRAQEKIKPVKGGQPIKLGWQPITTSNLIYEMKLRFLLAPGSDGKPRVIPQEPGEELLIKNPQQFRDLISEDTQIDEALGEKIALWSLGDPTKRDKGTDKLIKAFASLSVTQEMIEARLGHSIDQITTEELEQLRSVHAAIKKEPFLKDRLFEEHQNVG